MSHRWDISKFAIDGEFRNASTLQNFPGEKLRSQREYANKHIKVFEKLKSYTYTNLVSGLKRLI